MSKLPQKELVYSLAGLFFIASVGAMMLLPIKSELNACGSGGRYSLLLGQGQTYEEAIKMPPPIDTVTDNDTVISDGACVGSDRYNLYIL